MNKTEKMAELYRQAASLDEENPPELMKKLSIYGQLLELIGGFHAQSHGQWKLAEAKRKETIASVYSLDPEGSNKDREMKAEMAASEARKEEARLEGEAMRFRNAYQSLLEQINIMKKKYEHLTNVFQKGGV